MAVMFRNLSTLFSISRFLKLALFISLLYLVSPFTAGAITTSETDNIRDASILIITADNDTVSVGSELSYVVTYQNTGFEDYNNTYLRFILPTSLNFIESDRQTDMIVGNMYIFKLETLDPGAGGMISIYSEGNNFIDEQASVIATAVLEYEDEFGEVHTVSAFNNLSLSGKILAGDIDRRNLFAFISPFSTGLWMLAAALLMFAVYMVYSFRISRLPGTIGQASPSLNILPKPLNTPKFGPEWPILPGSPVLFKKDEIPKPAQSLEGNHLGLIAFSFALRKDGEPNPCNIKLASAVEKIVKDVKFNEGRPVTIVSQWEINKALDLSAAHVVEKHSEGKYLDSEEVVRQAAEVFRPNGIQDVIVVAHPFLHLTKCKQLVRNAGFKVVHKKVDWIGFDKLSDQPWTRGPFKLFFYSLGQLIKGKLSQKVA